MVRWLSVIRPPSPPKGCSGSGSSCAAHEYGEYDRRCDIRNGISSEQARRLQRRGSPVRSVRYVPIDVLQGGRVSAPDTDWVTLVLRRLRTCNFESTKATRVAVGGCLTQTLTCSFTRSAHVCAVEDIRATTHRDIPRVAHLRLEPSAPLHPVVHATAVHLSKSLEPLQTILRLLQKARPRTLLVISSIPIHSGKSPWQ